MISQVELANLILTFPALQRVSESLQCTMRNGSQSFIAQDGEVVFDLACHCLGAALVTRGRLRVLKPVSDRRSLLFCSVVPGEICILTVGSMLGASSYPVRGIAEGRVTGVWVPSDTFQQALDESAEFRSFAMKSVLERVAGVMRLVEEFAIRTVDQRVASLLLKQEEPISISHQQLAEEVGSVREVVSRRLEDWKGSGIVELGRQHIRVVDRGRLAAISDAGHMGEGRGRKIPTDSCISGHHAGASDSGSPVAANGSSLQS